jgi:hypothetical protein
MTNDDLIDDEIGGLNIAMESILVRLRTADLVVRFNVLLLKYAELIFLEVSKGDYQNFFPQNLLRVYL